MFCVTIYREFLVGTWWRVVSKWLMMIPMLFHVSVSTVLLLIWVLQWCYMHCFCGKEWVTYLLLSRYRRNWLLVTFFSWSYSSFWFFKGTISVNRMAARSVYVARRFSRMAFLICTITGILQWSLLTFWKHSCSGSSTSRVTFMHGPLQNKKSQKCCVLGKQIIIIIIMSSFIQHELDILRCAHGTQTNNVWVSCLNVCSDCKCSRSSAGRLFHILAPATAKFLVLSAVLAAVTTRQPDHHTGDVVGSPMRWQAHRLQPDNEVSVHAYTGRPSTPVCGWCAYKLEASEVHAGWAWCDQFSWSLLLAVAFWTACSFFSKPSFVPYSVSIVQFWTVQQCSSKFCTLWSCCLKAVAKSWLGFWN